MKRVAVRAYMSSANLGPGFDILAVALNAFYDTVEIKLVGEGFARIDLSVRGKYIEKIPSGEGNVVIGPIMKALEETGEKLQLEVTLEKGVPPGKGLGSSGASSAAAAKAINELLGGVFSEDELIYIAGEGERIASGEPHYDNVSASLLGGFVMVSPGEKISARRLGSGAGFEFLLVIPEIMMPEKKTGIARSVLPKQISLRDYVRNSSNLAKLIYGIV
ncbi:MAG: homoserine kinase, partial [Sulfolobales archaeon]